ncbi:hypothetical protein ACPESR_20215 [Nocardia testacea]|uniref:hypothetical protein n=1 Tax=Nocardia testacea TaxID=248551 RepID=UPI003C2E9FF3
MGLIAYHAHSVAVVSPRDSTALAVAEPREIDLAAGVREAGPLIFLDAPELVAVLAEQPGFEVITAACLDSPFDAAVWPRIDPGDTECWKPATLGAALFNYWD